MILTVSSFAFCFVKNDLLTIRAAVPKTSLNHDFQQLVTHECWNFLFIRRELGGTGTGCLFQFTYCVLARPFVAKKKISPIRRCIDALNSYVYCAIGLHIYKINAKSDVY